MFEWVYHNRGILIKTGKGMVSKLKTEATLERKLWIIVTIGLITLAFLYYYGYKVRPVAMGLALMTATVFLLVVALLRNPTKVIVATLAVFIVLGFLAYTGSSANHEPDIQIAIAHSSNTPKALFQNYSGISGSQTYQMASMGLSSVIYEFSVSLLNVTSIPLGNSHVFYIFMNKTDQSMNFPYLGDFVMEPIGANFTLFLEINGSRVADPGTEMPGTGATMVKNGTYMIYTNEYTPKIPFSTVNQTVARENGAAYASSIIGVTYSVEVVPIIILGPFHEVGQPKWISHTFLL